LFRLGYAHSAEAWLGDRLVGGLYGVAIGQVFYGESMFYVEPNASKVVFAELVNHLKAWGYRIIDCQVSTEHLISFGAEDIQRHDFLELLKVYCDLGVSTEAWQ
jgi:leucyl/phenylalanyl-tRNA--protein transferase